MSDSFRTLPDDDPRGAAYDLAIEAFEIEADTLYTLVAEVTGGPLVLSGASIATEGTWDDPLPVPRDNFNPWGAQLHGYQFELSWTDNADKRARMQYIVDRTDYVIISSNRFYGTLNRIPTRFPMSINYYEALFNGELGFELVGDYISNPNLGPLQFPDQNAEEAFTVYDHPRVLIFQKTSRYSDANTARILNQANLDEVEHVVANMVSDPPANLDPPAPARQRAAGRGLVRPL